HLRGAHEPRALRDRVAEGGGAGDRVAVPRLLGALAVAQGRGGEDVLVAARLAGGGHAPRDAPGRADDTALLLILEPVGELDREALGELAAAAAREQGQGSDVQVGPALAEEVRRALFVLAAVVDPFDEAVPGDAEARSEEERPVHAGAQGDD